MARPSKYTATLAAAICRALRLGNTRTAAAEHVGIHRSTLAEWIARYPTFADAVEKAEAQAEVRHVANIVAAAQSGTWTASAWWLERRRAQEWGQKAQLDVLIRREAERLAESLGLQPDEILREAESILAGSK